MTRLISGSGPRIVFIAGLEHSGTTLLDYCMGRHDSVIGLGEAYSLLDDDSRSGFFERWGHYDDADQCSCGARHANCPLYLCHARAQHLNAEFAYGAAASLRER